MEKNETSSDCSQEDGVPKPTGSCHILIGLSSETKEQTSQELENNEQLPEDEPEVQFMYLIHYLVSMSLEDCFYPDETDGWIFHAYDTIRETLEYLHYVFMKQIEEIFHSNTETILGSRITSVQFLLSRCLAICEEPSNLSLLMVWNFIYDILFYWVFERACHRIFFDCEFCLSALYKRKFWKIFRSKEDFDIFVSFSQKLLEVLKPKKNAGEYDSALDVLPDHGQYAAQLMENCANVIETDFHFTPLEMKFLRLSSEKMTSDDWDVTDCEKCKQVALEAVKDLDDDDDEEVPVPRCMRLSKETLISLEKFGIYVCCYCYTACSLFLCI
ncbi:hypothetical protein NPIL_317801 [Nephila pilipes]|uniref:Uncharacterized protein n=1 Tax=Nephila pilipes TaxID=299642 RepID=A0A8X6UN04_NEPPI|nr:hypothetical protein NPIL_317801 [Nephila pilipes]